MRADMTEKRMKSLIEGTTTCIYINKYKDCTTEAIEKYEDCKHICKNA